MTPAYGSNLDSQLERLIEQSFVRLRPKRPVYLPAFASTSLPAPADWTGAMIYASDKGCGAISNGVAWVRPDGTAL